MAYIWVPRLPEMGVGGQGAQVVAHTVPEGQVEASCGVGGQAWAPYVGVGEDLAWGPYAGVAWDP